MTDHAKTAAEALWRRWPSIGVQQAEFVRQAEPIIDAAIDAECKSPADVMGFLERLSRFWRAAYPRDIFRAESTSLAAELFGLGHELAVLLKRHNVKERPHEPTRG